jgi:hypothetical protein
MGPAFRRAAPGAYSPVLRSCLSPTVDVLHDGNAVQEAEKGALTSVLSADHYFTAPGPVSEIRPSFEAPVPARGFQGFWHLTGKA